MELIKIRKLDGKVIEYHDKQEKPLIVIRDTQKGYTNEQEAKNYRNDFGFIRGILTSYGKKIQFDNAGLDTDEGIYEIFNNPETKVVFVRNDKGGYDYVAFFWLDSPDEHKILGYNHVKCIHGLIRSFKTDEFMNKIYTPEYYKKAIRLNILEKIVDEIFCTQPDIITIDAELPEFLKERPVKARTDDKDKTEAITDRKDRRKRTCKDLPAHRILTKAGFRCPYTPRRNYLIKNGRPCDVFVYQVHRKWWERNKWQQRAAGKAE